MPISPTTGQLLEPDILLGAADIPVTQSAVIAYRRHFWQLKIVLVTSMNTQRWVLPKGNIETGLSPSESAAKEALEEAGVEGIVAVESIGTYQYTKVNQKGGGNRRVAVYPMAVTSLLSDWPERNVRQRKWMTVERAAAAVAEPELKELLDLFGREMSGN
jgi:8-oxo-dGTP pyrophosphatase MutT (NUDIX family)